MVMVTVIGRVTGTGRHRFTVTVMVPVIVTVKLPFTVTGIVMFTVTFRVRHGQTQTGIVM